MVLWNGLNVNKADLYGLVSECVLLTIVFGNRAGSKFSQTANINNERRSSRGRIPRPHVASPLMEGA
jgi:hypothetical protein